MLRLGELHKLVRRGDFNQRCKTLDENEENIRLLWQKAKRGRDVIDELNSFAEIVDLTEPRLEAKLAYLENLRYLVCLYSTYICLQIRAGISKKLVDK